MGTIARTAAAAALVVALAGAGGGLAQPAGQTAEQALGASSGAGWRVVINDVKSRMLIDAGAIRTTPEGYQSVRVCILLSEARPVSEMAGRTWVAAVSDEEVDCARRQTRRNASGLYDEQGQLIVSAFQQRDWRPVQAGANGELMVNAVCDKATMAADRLVPDAPIVRQRQDYLAALPH